MSELVLSLKCSFIISSIYSLFFISSLYLRILSYIYICACLSPLPLGINVFLSLLLFPFFQRSNPQIMNPRPPDVCQCVSPLRFRHTLIQFLRSLSLHCAYRDARCFTNEECRRRGAGQESGSACRGFGGGHRRCLKSNRAPSSRFPRCKYQRNKKREEEREKKKSQKRKLTGGFKRVKEKKTRVSKGIQFPDGCDLEKERYFLSLCHSLIEKRFFNLIKSSGNEMEFNSKELHDGFYQWRLIIRRKH